ncbi:MAG: hypothetical protein KDA92_14080 [Planctomycetales bacterium]|nr:hypothetical protein [Planctomycetales bacterium]
MRDSRAALQPFSPAASCIRPQQPLILTDLTESDLLPIDDDVPTSIPIVHTVRTLDPVWTPVYAHFHPSTQGSHPLWQTIGVTYHGG